MADPQRFDDLFAAFGPIRLKRFFGGEGIYAGAVMIGMVFSERLYFKTDDATRAAFLAEGCEPFSFLKRSTGETMVTSWYALPDRLYDDPEELAAWARAALGVVQVKAGKAEAKTPMRTVKTTGIDLVALTDDRAAVGLSKDGPDWTPALDKPALSRAVLKRKPTRNR